MWYVLVYYCKTVDGQNLLCGLISFVHPSQPLEEENNFEILGGAGDKVVQGLNDLSIYCPGT